MVVVVQYLELVEKGSHLVPRAWKISRILLPLEIIPLTTKRKENSWRTEEALARVFVTVETERIKGSNP